MQKHRNASAFRKNHLPLWPFSNYVSFNSVNRKYSCRYCIEFLHEQFLWEYEPWEIPQHLRKTHNLPVDRKWRMNFIPEWNEAFERQYLANSEKKIDYENPAKENLETDTKESREIEKKAKKRKQIEQQADRDGH